MLVQPGGQLVHSINAHTSDVDALDLTMDAKYAVTGDSFSNHLKNFFVFWTTYVLFM